MPRAGAVEAAVAQHDPARLGGHLLEAADRGVRLADALGGFGSSGSASVLTGPPVRSLGQPAKDCAIRSLPSAGVDQVLGALGP